MGGRGSRDVAAKDCGGASVSRVAEACDRGRAIAAKDCGGVAAATARGAASPRGDYRGSGRGSRAEGGAAIGYEIGRDRRGGRGCRIGTARGAAPYGPGSERGARGSTTTTKRSYSTTRTASAACGLSSPFSASFSFPSCASSCVYVHPASNRRPKPGARTRWYSSASRATPPWGPPWRCARRPTPRCPSWPADTPYLPCGGRKLYISNIALSSPRAPWAATSPSRARSLRSRAWPGSQASREWRPPAAPRRASPRRWCLRGRSHPSGRGTRSLRARSRRKAALASSRSSLPGCVSLVGAVRLAALPAQETAQRCVRAFVATVGGPDQAAKSRVRPRGAGETVFAARNPF